MTDWKALGEKAIARFPKTLAFLAADEQEEKTMQPKDPINWNRETDGDPWEATITLSNPEGESRTVAKFIPFDMENAVDDGTCRCIACGQIDDEPWHEDRYCGQWNPLDLPPFEAPPMPPVEPPRVVTVPHALTPEAIREFLKEPPLITHKHENIQQPAPQVRHVIGSPEWKDMAERCEWAFMRDIIDEAIRDHDGPVPSYWYVVRGVADARSKKGWREL